MQIEITPTLLANLKDKAEKATDGPWIAQKDGESRTIVTGYDVYGVDNSCQMIAAMVFGENTHKYIAAANPAVILALIERIEQLEKGE